MSFELRILLTIGAILTTIYFGIQVKKGRVDIQYSIFWIIFSLFLVLVSLFPGMIIYFSKLFKFQSPTNLLFLIIIFILLFNEFLMTVKISKLEEKNKNFVQKIALYYKKNK